MSESILAGGFLLFIAMLILHLLIWRSFQVEKEIFSLLFIFLVVPFLFLFLMVQMNFCEVKVMISTGILYFSLALVYLETYPALKTEIPSFRILVLIHQQKNQGLEESQIIKSFSNESELFSDKVIELKKDSLVTLKEDGYIGLTFAGSLLAVLFMFYRRLLRLEWGQG